MAQSMTGYGRSEEILHGRTIVVEIKSVNSRYFEYSSRLPRNFGFLDEALKKAVAAALTRGKVEVSLLVQNLESGDVQVKANIAVAKGYKQALDEIHRQLGVPYDIQTSLFGRFPDVFTVCRTETDEEELRADVLAVTSDAIARYNHMRTEEGDKLNEDILARLVVVERMCKQVERDSEGRVKRYTQRLYERLKEVLESTTIEESRMLTEAAIFADKTAVDEESVRLASHIEQYRGILAADGPKGRKLDFLTQELNREVNTIGSKCQELEITRLVVEMKAELEKIREQIQNLE